MKIRKTIEIEINTKQSKVARAIFSKCLLDAYEQNKELVEEIRVIEEDD